MVPSTLLTTKSTILSVPISNTVFNGAIIGNAVLRAETPNLAVYLINETNVSVKLLTYTLPFFRTRVVFIAEKLSTLDKLALSSSTIAFYYLFI